MGMTRAILSLLGYVPDSMHELNISVSMKLKGIYIDLRTLVDRSCNPQYLSFSFNIVEKL